VGRPVICAIPLWRTTASCLSLAILTMHRCLTYTLVAEPPSLLFISNPCCRHCCIAPVPAAAADSLRFRCFCAALLMAVYSKLAQQSAQTRARAQTMLGFLLSCRVATPLCALSCACIFRVACVDMLCCRGSKSSVDLLREPFPVEGAGA
jgi:hypothetical protein